MAIPLGTAEPGFADHGVTGPGGPDVHVETVLLALLLQVLDLGVPYSR
ncbi:hypothetical protein ACFT8P_19215 [Streptomyces sp. NPDC057101]